jgi:hypothetical protein
MLNHLFKEAGYRPLGFPLRSTHPLYQLIPAALGRTMSAAAAVSEYVMKQVKDGSLVKAQAFIGGQWVDAASGETFEVSVAHISWAVAPDGLLPDLMHT